MEQTIIEPLTAATNETQPTSTPTPTPTPTHNNEETTRQNESSDTGTPVKVEAKRRRKIKALPPEMARLGRGDHDKLILSCIADQSEQGSNQQQQSVKVEKILLPDNSHWTIPELTLDQWRTFARNLGVKSFSILNKVTVMPALAALKLSGNVYRNAHVVNPTVNDRVSTTSAHCRIINATFHPEIFPRFLQMHQERDRSYAFGVENDVNHRNLWTDISDMVNDTEQTDLDKLTLVDASTGDNDNNDIISANEDPHIAKAIEEDGINPKHFLFRTSASYVADTLKRLIEIRNIMRENMTTKKSGENTDDPMNYVEAAIKAAAKETSKVSEIAAYYFFQRCAAHPELNAALPSCLADCLKATSNDDVAEMIMKDKERKLDSRKANNKKVEQFLENIQHQSNVITNLLSGNRNERSTLLQTELRHSKWRHLMELEKFVRESISEGMTADGDELRMYQEEIRALKDELTSDTSSTKKRKKSSENASNNASIDLTSPSKKKAHNPSNVSLKQRKQQSSNINKSKAVVNVHDSSNESSDEE